MTSPFAGIWTAIATPFQSDGSVDWTAFERLLAHQEAGGVTGVVVSGTTGEAPTLTVQEKISLVRKARAQLNKNIRVMAGSGGNNTQQSVELSRLCVDAGADSLLIVTPPYNKPNPTGMRGHFEAISAATTVPICLYHVPGRTGQLLTPAAIAQLCDIPRVVAVKEASGDVALFSRLVNRTKAVVLSGDDPTYLASLAVGAVGVISVVSNVFPKEFGAMHQAFVRHEHEKALTYHKALLSFIDLLFCESNPTPLKSVLATAGLCQDHVRLPLGSISKENAALIAKSYQETKAALSGLG